MKNRPDDMRSIRIIDDLASSSPRRMFALSPNDALVQIALPLVLILAIITRLMVIGQTVAARDRGPVILEMWKQQLILRIDQVMDDWEASAELGAFPEFSRVQWQGPFPTDDRFGNLCRNSLLMNNWEDLKLDQYHQALRYQPPDRMEQEGAAYHLLDLYDPQAKVQPEHPENIPPEFIITPERRAYALGYIEDRMLQWKQQVEGLQWAAVAECAARLPMEEEEGADRASAQMSRIAADLKERGYPLMHSVTEEYGKTP